MNASEEQAVQQAVGALRERIVHQHDVLQQAMRVNADLLDLIRGLVKGHETGNAEMMRAAKDFIEMYDSVRARQLT